MVTNDVFAKDDGITHVNVYSQGKTELGRKLSNFCKTPFTTADGIFQSVESWWYWFKTGNDVYKDLVGFKAKEFFRKNNKEADLVNPTPEDLKEVYLQKLAWHPHIKELLLENKLPLAHYYVMQGKQVCADEFLWTVQLWQDIINELRDEREDVGMNIPFKKLGSLGTVRGDCLMAQVAKETFVKQSTLSVYYGTCDYKYSGALQKAKEFPEYLQTVAEDLEADLNLPLGYFNMVLVNKYPDGKGLGMHKDAEPEITKGSTIASVSLGADRVFRITGKANVDIVMSHGDIIIMDKDAQENYFHQVVAGKGVRYNLTFRHNAKATVRPSVRYLLENVGGFPPEFYGRNELNIKEQVSAAIALLVAKGGFDYVVGVLENDIFESEREFEEWQMHQEADENGQLSLPATAETKEQPQKKFRGEVQKCKTGLNTKVSLDGSMFFVPTALIKARGLERGVVEMRKTAQEGMKPRWDMLLAGFF